MVVHQERKNMPFLTTNELYHGTNNSVTAAQPNLFIVLFLRSGEFFLNHQFEICFVVLPLLPRCLFLAASVVVEPIRSMLISIYSRYNILLRIFFESTLPRDK